MVSDGASAMVGKKTVCCAATERTGIRRKRFHPLPLFNPPEFVHKNYWI
jgi:hypothetical protein